MSVPRGRALLLCLSLCAAAALWTAALLYRPAPARTASGVTRSVTVPEPAHSPAAEANPAEPGPPTIYQLRSVDGEVCVFRGRTLLHRTGVATRTLPREDRALLERGICAASQEALASLLEDYCS